MSNLKVDYNYNIIELVKNDKDSLIISLNGDEVLSKYKDDYWDLSVKLLTNNSSKIKGISFENKNINNIKLNKFPFLHEALKDVTYKMIVSGEKTQTIYHKVNRIMFFYHYIVNECNKNNLNELTKDEINMFFNYLKINKSEFSKSIVLSYLNAVKMFFKYRVELKYNIEFEPFLEVTSGSLAKHKSNKQKEVIPDEDWKYIVSCCENEINEFVTNISEEKYIIENYKDKLNKGMKLKARDILHKSQYFREKYKTVINHKIHLENIQYYGGILIQAYTGMRMSELLSLKRDCIIREKYETETFKGEITKIKGITFKYEDVTSIDIAEGRSAYWYCPNVILRVIEVLNVISEYTEVVLKNHTNNSNDIKDKMGNLFVSVKKPIAKSKNNVVSFTRFDLSYNKKINELGIETPFKITSHSFRRTFARFLARSILKIEVDIIKDQFKHFSKDITLYYMRESDKMDAAFSELIEGYITAQDNNDVENEKALCEKIDYSLQQAIMTANNFDELSIFMAGRQLKVVNEYTATINDKNTVFSPIECLTCDGNVILPDVHKSYWEELLVMYKELIEHEPNAIRFQQERKMVEEVLNKLNKKEVYITGGDNE
jgi:integrase